MATALTLSDLIEAQAALAKKDKEANVAQERISVAQLRELHTQSEHVKATAKSLEKIANNTQQSVKIQADSKKLAEQPALADPLVAEKKKREEELVEKMKDLNATIKDQIKSALKGGYGEDKAGGIEAKGIKQANENKGGMLRSMLLGGEKGDEVKKNSWFQKVEDKTGMKVGKFSPGGAIDSWLTKREEKQAYEKEKKEYVKGALVNDAGTRGVANFKGGVKTEEGLAAGTQFAEKKFAEIKAKEKELLEAQKKIDASKAAGYNPMAKDVKARDAIAGELATLDPREKSQFKADAKKAMGGSSSKEMSEDQAETFKQEVTADAAQLAQFDTIGKTLFESLDIHKQQLETLKKLVEAGAAGAGGGSMLGDALSTASDFAGKGGKGKMLGKAAGFLGKHAGKIGAIGGVAMGAYDAYSGWSDANDKLASGEITKDEADVKKGEAVGGGVGGAAGAWGGAAAGAAIGSVVPVVGTAIGGLVGGAIGYYGGSKIGSKVGGALTEGYKGAKSWLGFGGDEKGAEGVKPQVTKSSMETLADEPVEKGKPLSPKQVSVAEMSMKMGNKLSPLAQEAYDLAKKQPKAEVSTKPVAESPIASASKSNEDIKATANPTGGGNTNIVNAPSTSIVNNNSNTGTKYPQRNQESSMSRYINSRYAV